ncbi:hypothetical protein BHE74_00044422 [Ensete ventricosum]|nr:hypothetical protein BHE74_00044422 [Ensete ventricosum]
MNNKLAVRIKERGDSSSPRIGTRRRIVSPRGTSECLVSPRRNKASPHLLARDEALPHLPMGEPPRSGYPLFYFYLQDFLNRLVKDHGSIDLEWLKDIEPVQSK